MLRVCRYYNYTKNSSGIQFVWSVSNDSGDSRPFLGINPYREKECGDLVLQAAPF